MKVDEPFFGLLSMRFDGFCKLVSDRVVLIELSFWSFLRISGYFTFSLRKPNRKRSLLGIFRNFYSQTDR